MRVFASGTNNSTVEGDALEIRRMDVASGHAVRLKGRRSDGKEIAVYLTQEDCLEVLNQSTLRLMEKIEAQEKLDRQRMEARIRDTEAARAMLNEAKTALVRANRDLIDHAPMVTKTRTLRIGAPVKGRVKSVTVGTDQSVAVQYEKE